MTAIENIISTTHPSTGSAASEERHRTMRAIQRRVAPQLDAFSDVYEDPKLKQSVLALLQRKLSAHSVRSSYTVFTYDYIMQCAEQEKIDLHPLLSKEDFNVKLPFIIDCVMSLMYLDNQIFDKKSQVASHERVVENMLGGKLLERLLFGYIRSHFGCKTSQLISDYVWQMFDCVNMGQWLDKKFNDYEGWKSNTCRPRSLSTGLDGFVNYECIRETVNEIQDELPGKAEYVELYFTRIFLSCASLFVLTTELLLRLTGYHGKERQNLLDFARAHGVMRQIVNDNIDFVKTGAGTVGKQPGDVLSDLKNKTITLPLMSHLHRCGKDNLARRFLETGDRRLLDSSEEAVLEEVIRSGALPWAMRIGRRLAGEEGVLRFLDMRLPAAAYLENLGEIAFNNRFYHQAYRCRHRLEKEKS